MARVRTFIAVDAGRTPRQRVVALQEELAAVAEGVKWVEPENLHLTLFFLGLVDQRELPALCRVVAEQARQVTAFDIKFEGLGCFPNSRRPRTLWVGVSTGGVEIVGLHARMEEPLLELGCYRREARAFTPHLTIGRAKGEQPAEGLGEELTRRAHWNGGRTTIDEVLVMSSELLRQGPEYTVLARSKLG